MTKLNYKCHWRTLISQCVLLMLFSVDHLISCLDGTVMSVGRSSSSHAHLQTFHNSCRPHRHLIRCGCHINVHVIVILIMINQRKNILELCQMCPGNLLGWICRQTVTDSLYINTILQQQQQLLKFFTHHSIIRSTWTVSISDGRGYFQQML